MRSEQNGRQLSTEVFPRPNLKSSPIGVITWSAQRCGVRHGVHRCFGLTSHVGVLVKAFNLTTDILSWKSHVNTVKNWNTTGPLDSCGPTGVPPHPWMLLCLCLCPRRVCDSLLFLACLTASTGVSHLMIAVANQSQQKVNTESHITCKQNM